MVSILKSITARKPRTNHENAQTSERLYRRIILGAIIVVGPVLLLILYCRIHVAGLTNPDALDFAQIGRNVASGRGFTTLLLRPLALTHGNDPLGQPDIVHGPLFSLCLAIAFAAFGARDSVAIGVSALFFLLTIPMVYLLGKRSFGSVVGTLSALVFTLSALTLDYATSGLHLTLCIFLMTSLFLVIYEFAATVQDAAAGSAKLPKFALSLAGSLVALLYLADPLFFWIAPVVGALLIWVLPAHRIEAAGFFLLPCIALGGPWMARNALLTGNPVFALRGAELWMNTPNNFPGMSAYRMAPADVFARPGLLQDIIHKVGIGVGTVLDSWPHMGGNWVLVFFLPSLFFRFTDPAANSLRRVIMAGLLALTSGMLLFEIQMPLIVALVPGMLVFAVAYLSFLVGQARLGPSAKIRAALILGAALLYPLVNTLMLVPKPTALTEREAAVELSAKSRVGDVVLTDQPWTVAWYSNRPAVLVPLSEARITDARQQFPGMRWLFVTQSVSLSSPEWRGFYDGLLRWNLAYSAAREGRLRPPDGIRVTARNALDQPVLAALTGFETYPPLEHGVPSTLVAFAPRPDPDPKALYSGAGPNTR